MRSKKTFTIVETVYAPLDKDASGKPILVAKRPIVAVNVIENVEHEELGTYLKEEPDAKYDVVEGPVVQWRGKYTIEIGEPRTRKPRVAKPATDGGEPKVKRTRRTAAQIAADKKGAVDETFFDKPTNGASAQQEK